jgi:LCP family protein required for cell wall assembly
MGTNGGRARGARRVLKAIARVVLVMASAATLVATGLGWHLQQSLDRGLVTSNAVDKPQPAKLGEPFTALLVGLDARTDAAGNPLPRELLDEMHAGPDEGQLHTDTIILLHVPAAPGQPAVAISIPRDSYVEIAGDRGKHKINSAYSRGVEDAKDSLSKQGITGADLDRQTREAGRRALIATVEALTGVGIDHFAEINLAGFLELTDALGGVPVCLNHAVRDSYSGIDLPAGPQTVSGAGALAFVRQRHGLEAGDLDRIARQQAFIAGLTRRLNAAGTLADPAQLNRLVQLVTRHVVIDSGWDVDEAAMQLRMLSGGDLTFHTIPTRRPDLETPYDGIAVQIDPDDVRVFVRSLIYGTPAASTTTPTTAPSATPSRSATPSPSPTTTPTTTPRVIAADEVPCVN